MRLDPHHITLLSGKRVVIGMESGNKHRGLVMGAVNPTTLSIYSESNRATMFVDLDKVCTIVTLPPTQTE